MTPVIHAAAEQVAAIPANRASTASIVSSGVEVPAVSPTWSSG